MQTALMARWSGTWRGLGAPRRRRPRGRSGSHTRHRGQVWLRVSLSNGVLPHKRLRPGRTARPPALARGLTDQVWSSGEDLWLPVQTAPGRSTQMDERMARRLSPALQGQLLGRTQAPTQAEMRGEPDKEAAPLPKAA